jgi:hypothetical protein
MLFLLVKLPWRIVLSEDAVIRQYLLFRRVVPYQAIGKVELRSVPTERGKRVETVAVQLKDGRVLSLRNLKSEGRTLYEALELRVSLQT